MDLKSVLSVVNDALGVVRTMASAGANVFPSLTVLSKGVAIIDAMTSAGTNAGPALEVLANTFTQGKQSVTQSELDKSEAQLDAMLDKYNLPLPPEDA